jgi:endonuclease/exonuclease/phosphatase family metal-dependent hydrolase
MRIVTWNLAHSAGSDFARRKPAAHLAAALEQLRPDVVVLTEYVPTVSAGLTDALATVGLRFPLTSRDQGAGNQVLIASRSPLAGGEMLPPQYHRTCTSNVVHAQLIDAGLHIFGVRVPMWREDPHRLTEMWDWIDQVGNSYRDKPAVLLGDLNVDPNRCRRVPAAGARIRSFMENWQHAAPAVGASYYTVTRGKEFPKCIDHAFVSKAVAVANAEYRESAGEWLLVDRQRPKSTKRSLSDHAALVVDLDINRAAA